MDYQDKAANARMAERGSALTAARETVNKEYTRDWGAALGKSSTPTRPTLALEEAQSIVQADRDHRSLAADQTLMLNMVMPFARQAFTQLTSGLYSWFRHQGFWPKDVRTEAPWNTNNESETVTISLAEYIRLKKAEKIALLHSELSEALEAVRSGDFQNEQEEMADVQVRLFDYQGGFGHDAATAFEEKMVKNFSRPYKHARKF